MFALISKPQIHEDATGVYYFIRRTVPLLDTCAACVGGPRTHKTHNKKARRLGSLLSGFIAGTSDEALAQTSLLFPRPRSKTFSVSLRQIFMCPTSDCAPS